MLRINIYVKSPLFGTQETWTIGVTYWNVLSGCFSTCFLKNLLKLEDNYNIVVVFAIREYELAVGMSVSPPILSLPRPTLPCPSFQVAAEPGHPSDSLVICLGDVYVSVLFSQIAPPSPPTESRSLFFTSPLLPCAWDHQYRLSRCPKCAVMYIYLCLSDFPLYDRL